MKVEVKNTVPKFNPVQIILTCESQDEVDTITGLFLVTPVVDSVWDSTGGKINIGDVGKTLESDLGNHMQAQKKREYLYKRIKDRIIDSESPI